MPDKDILECVQSSKNIIDADSDDDNEMNPAAPVPTSSEMRNMKSISSYLDPHSNAKYECIGRIQKRVGTKLRKLKSKRKDLGGRGKLTDAIIDKLQNYYGIAIRDNVNNLQGMRWAVIAAFFHCCSNAKQQMHGQCPVGPDSWCKCQQAVSKDKIYIDKSKGLPPNLINIIKPRYMKLCEQNLLAKCLPVSAQTVRNIEHSTGLKARSARKKPYISEVNRKRRLEFAMKYKNKPMDFWKKVIFSDESKFEIFTPPSIRKVWRKNKTALETKNVLPTLKYGGGNVMVWGCVAHIGASNL
ncbi:uncharacterized protein TNCV_983391 [Trichonephila clavipes]|nr:uncharacterized protein TNCV_983391 [Trichonephila clavipes]